MNIRVSAILLASVLLLTACAQKMGMYGGAVPIQQGAAADQAYVVIGFSIEKESPEDRGLMAGLSWKQFDASKMRLVPGGGSFDLARTTRGCTIIEPTAPMCDVTEIRYHVFAIPPGDYLLAEVIRQEPGYPSVIRKTSLIGLDEGLGLFGNGKRISVDPDLSTSKTSAWTFPAGQLTYLGNLAVLAVGKKFRPVSLRFKGTDEKAAVEAAKAILGRELTPVLARPHSASSMRTEPQGPGAIVSEP